jgi:CxxC motif-containing protein (DUF1111 family)
MAFRKVTKASTITMVAYQSFLFSVFVLVTSAVCQADPYPHNAVSCERCHSVPTIFGGSSMTVQRKGSSVEGKIIPAPEGGIHHRSGESAKSSGSTYQITGDRVSLNLLGDGYIEAVDRLDIEQNALRQRQANLGIAGLVVNPPVLESGGSTTKWQIGRFGWKSQHTSLMSSCADSLRNELGMRNRLYPDEYPTHAPSDSPTPFDTPDARTHKTELERLVDEIRHTSPPPRDPNLAVSPDAQAGEKLFTKIGCAVCHVPTYKTLPPGTLINGGTYKVPKFLGNVVIYPYSDFLLHDVGTGDGIPQAAKPEYLDQSTANKFRTAPLWGLRFRQDLMHDGDSPGTEAAVKRHGGEATAVRRQYEQLTPTEKQQLQQFLSSL